MNSLQNQKRNDRNSIKTFREMKWREVIIYQFSLYFEDKMRYFEQLKPLEIDYKSEDFKYPLVKPHHFWLSPTDSSN